MHTHRTSHAADLPSTVLRASSPTRTVGVGCLIIMALICLHIGLFWMFREASAKSKIPEDPKGATMTFELSVPPQPKTEIAGPESPKPQPIPPAPAAKPEPKPTAPKKPARAAEPKKKPAEKKPVEHAKPATTEASPPAPSTPAPSTSATDKPNQQPSSAPAPAGTGSETTAVVPAQEGRFKVSNPKPKYSMQARRQHLSGIVVVKVMVSEDGRVTDAQIKTSSGHSLLDDSALEAVRMWQLEPMRQGGRTVSSWKEISFNFHLN